MKCVRQLFTRNPDDLKREIRNLGKVFAEGGSILTQSDVLVLSLSELDAAAGEAISQAVSAGHGDIGFYYNDLNGKAILCVPKHQAYEFCARADSISRELQFVTSAVKTILSHQPLTGPCFKIGRRTYRRTGAPFLMGILNVTPDSFSDGGEFFEPDRAVARALRMVDEGADFIDIGGESTQPGAQPVSIDDEIARVTPVIEAVVRQTDIPVSIDTTKSKVADRALDAGAVIVNDISGMTWDQNMAEVVVQHNASVVLMHIKGIPGTMQEKPFYDDLIAEVYDFLFKRKQIALQAGIEAERIIIDPGIGFGKRLGDNFELIGRLAEFSTLGPVMLGPSRKSFIGKVLDLPVTERVIGTAAAAAISTYLGVDILRVHDVGEMKQAAAIAWQCKVGSGAEIEQ